MHAVSTPSSLLSATSSQERVIEIVDPKSLRISSIFTRHFPSIKECECFQFDRNRFPKFRSQFEDTIIELTNQSIPAKEDTIRILDIGAGGCFQTLALLDKFLKDGYHNIELTVVDQCYAASNCHGSNRSVEQLQQFVEEELLTKYPEAKVNIRAEVILDEVFEKYTTTVDQPPHVVLMIDIQSETMYTSEKKQTTLLEYSTEFILKNKEFPDSTIVVNTDVTQIPRGGIGDEFCYGKCAPKSWLKMMERMARVLNVGVQDFCKAERGREHGIIYYAKDGYKYKKVEENK